MLYVQSWSGGKDSTVSAFEHLKHNHDLLLLCCIPMFDNKIPLIDKNQYSFILEMVVYYVQMRKLVSVINFLPSILVLLKSFMIYKKKSIMTVLVFILFVANIILSRTINLYPQMAPIYLF